MSLLRIPARAAILCLFVCIVFIPFDAFCADDGAAAHLLASGDEVKVTVDGEPDLSGIFVISRGGAISYPLIGLVTAKGLDASQLENVLQEKLADGYLVNPDVSVEISNNRQFHIIGEVRSPGSYGYVRGMSVSEAVAAAGGFTFRADKTYVEVLKTGKAGSPHYGKVSVEEAVAPGDIILVKERFF